MENILFQENKYCDGYWMVLQGEGLEQGNMSDVQYGRTDVRTVEVNSEGGEEGTVQ